MQVNAPLPPRFGHPALSWAIAIGYVAAAASAIGAGIALAQGAPATTLLMLALCFLCGALLVVVAVTGEAVISMALSVQRMELQYHDTRQR